MSRLRFVAVLYATLIIGLAFIESPAFASAPPTTANAKIAFSRSREGRYYEIHVMSADGSRVTRLTSDNRDVQPAWSPDGSKIAFAGANTLGADYDIYVMNSDGTGQTRLNFGEDGDLWPDWQRIAATQIASNSQTKFSFGKFPAPGLGSTTSDSEKADAPIVETTSIFLDDYPIGYEMVRARVDWSGSPLPSDVDVRIAWYNLDTGTLLKEWSYTWKAGYDWGWACSWLGHKSSGEIDRAGNYAVKFYASGLFEHSIVFVVQEARLTTHVVATSQRMAVQAPTAGLSQPVLTGVVIGFLFSTPVAIYRPMRWRTKKMIGLVFLVAMAIVAVTVLDWAWSGSTWAVGISALVWTCVILLVARAGRDRTARSSYSGKQCLQC